MQAMGPASPSSKPSSPQLGSGYCSVREGSPLHSNQRQMFDGGKKNGRGRTKENRSGGRPCSKPHKVNLGVRVQKIVSEVQPLDLRLLGPSGTKQGPSNQGYSFSSGHVGI